jgi:hypothetical protein
MTHSSGASVFPILAGIGTRMVVADNTGSISTQAIPGGGGGSMTGVAVATSNGFAGTSDGAAVVPTLTLTTSVTGLLKGNGTAISAETTTGSGDVVRATSPTLVTPALGTPSALVGTNITGTASGLTAGTISSQANSATITASSTGTINTIALRDGNADVFARTFNMNTAYGDFAPNKLVGTSAGGQIREMSQAQAQSYLGLGSNAYTSTTFAPLASPGFTGNPTAPTQSAADNSTKLATTAYVDNAGTFKANLNSPTFTGTPSLPTGTIGVTQTAGDNSTKLATTAYVDTKAVPTLAQVLTSGAISGLPFTTATHTISNGALVANTSGLSSQVLTVSASGSNSPAASITSTVVSGSTGNILNLESNSGTMVYFKNDGTIYSASLGTGTVQATSGVLSVSSDSRVKDVRGLFQGSASEAISRIEPPKYWNYNAKSGLPKETFKVKQFGLLADKVHAVLGEEFAPTQKDGTNSLSDRALLSLAIQAIQELQARIKVLESK